VKGVGEIGIAIASFHLNAAPFYVMIVMVAFGQSLQITQVIGAAILAFGVILSQTKKA
jgi:drug/metabolite transporter (DMT)-like permease